MSKVSGKAFDYGLFIRVVSYSKPYKASFFFTAFLTFLSAALGPVRPLLIQYTLDNSVLSPNASLLLSMTMLMLGFLLIEVVTQYYQSYLANWVGQSIIKDIRAEVFKKITSFKLKYFDKTPIGTLVTRSVSDIETIANIFSEGILIIIGDLLKLIFVLAIMFYTDWRLSLFSVSTIPILLIATRIFQRSIKSAFKDVRTEVSRLNTFVQEHITGMNIVQIFNREKREMQKFEEINHSHMNAHIRTVYANAIFFPVVEILSACSLALLVWWGGKEALADNVSYGSLVAFILYIYMLYRPIRQLADRFNILQMGMVGSERVFKVIDTEESIPNQGSIPADNIKGDIKIENLWFAYNDENWVLKDFNLEIKRGQNIAFVGATGAGKSTVVNLLSRFYEFQKGSIYIDGVNLHDYELESLRSHVGVVLQDVFLFSDSVLNNITLGNPDISREQVIEAAKSVGAHDFIMRLPGNYDFDVKERGGVLSVGQRQLLAFIRAFVYNPEILILDEATSSVDTESEQMIQAASEKITQGRTSLIIAHRLATIQNADQIIVLEKGKIIESGTHSSLLEKGGHYKTLFDMQFAEEN